MELKLADFAKGGLIIQVCAYSTSDIPNNASNQTRLFPTLRLRFEGNCFHQVVTEQQINKLMKPSQNLVSITSINSKANVCIPKLFLVKFHLQVILEASSSGSGY